MQSLRSKKVQIILAEVTRWASHQSDIRAAALVGSWARGTARLDSDIDLMFLAANPLLFRDHEVWVDDIRWSSLGTAIRYWEDKDYGAVWSRYIFLEDQTEIEFSFGSPSWASTRPVDPGTFQVVSNGCQILYDSENLLMKLLDKLGAS